MSGVSGERCIEVAPGVLRWTAYSPQHRVELSSHAVIVGRRIYLFDPIGLEPAGVDELKSRGKIEAIVVTNGNHERDARRWREACGVPIWCSRTAGLELPGLHRFENVPGNWADWEIDPISGGAPGEVALRCRALDLVVCGDAVVNLPGRGLELLPDKYCSDAALLRLSLGEYVARPFSRLLMAHGAPILNGASAALTRLLERAA